MVVASVTNWQLIKTFSSSLLCFFVFVVEILHQYFETAKQTSAVENELPIKPAEEEEDIHALNKKLNKEEDWTDRQDSEENKQEINVVDATKNIPLSFQFPL